MIERAFDYLLGNKSGRKGPQWAFVKSLAVRLDFKVAETRLPSNPNYVSYAKAFGVYQGRKTVVKGQGYYRDEGSNTGWEFYTRIRIRLLKKPMVFFEIGPGYDGFSFGLFPGYFGASTNSRKWLEYTLDPIFQERLLEVWNPGGTSHLNYKGDILELDLEGLVENEEQVRKVENLLVILSELAERIETGEKKTDEDRFTDFSGEQGEMFF